MNLALKGIGLATPGFRISQEDACELTYDMSCDSAEQRRKMSAIYRRSGVRERGSVLLRTSDGSLDERETFYLPRIHPDDRGPGTAARMRLYQAESLPLAVQASCTALNAAGYSAGKVTHLITVSCSGFSAPGIDVGLIQDLQLDRSTPRTHVGFMGCHAAFNALRIASAIAAADPAALVLVCAVELCSLHHFYGWDPEKIVANALFADGAGAAVCGDKGRNENSNLCVLRHGSTVIDGTLDAMSWNIGDNGFEITLSQEVPQLIEKHLRPWLDSFLRAEGLRVESVGSWAIHPGGPRILDACRKALALTEDHLAISRQILAAHGNMSSATIFFLLDRLKQLDATRPIVALGFGPGLTIEAMILG